MCRSVKSSRKGGRSAPFALGLFAATVLGVLPNAVVHAQETDSPEANTGDSSELVDVVVTAQRRAERLQDVPVSVQVVVGDTLARQNLDSLTDVSKTVPSVTVAGAGRSTALFIRGIGSGGNQAFDQSVGLFIDDIYHGRSRMSVASFLDVERVEILKGPQSTYFGNNAIAGAFNIITKGPTSEFDANARALYGEDGEYAVEGALNMPLTDGIAARVAIGANGMDGWVDNTTTGAKVPYENNKAARLTFLFNPTDNLDATLKFEGNRNRNSGYPLTLVDCPPPAPFVVVASSFCGQALSQGLPIGYDVRKSAQSAGQGVKLNGFENVLEVNYQQWNHTFSSVSGYYTYDYNLNLDTDGLPATLLHAQAPETYHQFSQELRVASRTHQTIEYLAGLYYQTDGLKAATTLNYGFLNGALAATPFAPYLPLGQTIAGVQDELSYSAFGSLTWNATDRLKFTGGLRSSWVEKDFDWNLFYGASTAAYGGLVPLPANLAGAASNLGLGRAGAITLSRNDHAVMPSGKVQYQLTPEAMAYVSYARGFKAGGFNIADNTNVASNLPFGPERVHAYETGIKSEWFEKRVLTNLAVFLSDYSDLQVSSNINSNGQFLSLVRNAATARSQGVELEVQWAVTPSFRLSAAGTYLDAHYGDYQNVSLSVFQGFCRTRLTDPTCAARFPGGVGQFQDLSGTPTNFAPKWSGSMSAAYIAALTSSLRLTTELNSYLSSNYYQNVLDEWDGSYARFDARLTLENPEGDWAIDLIGENLTNYETHGYFGNLPTSSGSGLIQATQPRNLAVQFRYHW